MYRIGVLSTTGAEQGNLIWADLRGHLREYGWAEGKNLVIDWRYAEAKYERLPDLAAELVGPRAGRRGSSEGGGRFGPYTNHRGLC